VGDCRQAVAWVTGVRDGATVKGALAKVDSLAGVYFYLDEWGL